MKKFATTLFMICMVGSAWAQKEVTVTGWIADEQQAPLMAATVVLLQPSDSVMVSFGISSETGGFSMAKVPTGDYILQMAFMGFQDISQMVTIPEGEETVDLGVFTMQERTEQLNEVTVTADHIPLLIRGDTVDYNARAFDTETNAVVEDLLRKLPGVEVEPDGTIKAQGEEVQQVLVDGKEFFGTDASIATRNLPADALERVQVYDKGSEASEFTGVDDGTRIKTIDLRLKEDKKNGLFGKVGGGYGTQNVYTGNATLNRFGGGTQLSVIGASNNRNLPAFSLGDYIGFQGGMQALSGGGGISLQTSDMDPRNQSGITTSHAGGVNFNHEFSESLDLRSSYFFNAANNLLEGNTLRQSLLTDNAFRTEEGTFRTTGQNSHRGNVRLIWERPEQSSFTFSTDARFGGNSGFGENTSQTLSGDGVLQNSQERTNSTEGQSHSVDSRATYRQLFAKPGRLLTLEGRGNWSAQRSDMMLLANSRFANDPQGETFTTELLDQRQDEDQDNLGYSAAAIYTEPLGRGRYLETAYRRGSSTETYAKDFYDREDGSEVLNTELSNAFTKRYTTDRLGVSLRINQNDYGLTAGVDFLNSQLSAVLASDVPLNRNFMNFLPRLSAEYEFTTTKSINFEYSTTLNEPTLQQLQPVLNNANPLVTVTGNPDLVPEYRHSAQLGYHSFSQLNFRSLFSMVNVVYTRNKITNTQTIDSQFRQVITPENTGDALMGMGYLGGSILIKPIKTSLRMNGTYVYNQQQQWVNGVENQTQRKTTQLQVSLDNKKKEVLDWTVGTRFNVTDVRYSELISLNQQYSQLTYYTILRIPLGPRLKVNTTFDYQQYFGEQFGGTQTVPLWSASISRTFGPTERLEVKATAFDLLNQNVGISRNASLNFIEDVQYNALSRYFLLTATWSLNKFGPQKSFFTISGQGI